MKFIRLHDKTTGINYPWMADVQSFADFMEIEEKFCSRNAACIWDFLNSREYKSTIRDFFEAPESFKKTNLKHCEPWNKLCSFFMASVMSCPVNTVFNPIGFLTEKLTDVSKHKIKCLEQYGRIFINSDGGFMMWHKNLEEIESIDCDTFPQYSIKEVRVSKWPEGKHWYATINGTSIIFEGRNKWNTEKAAWDAAKKWLDTH